jgi:putative endopeptidase
MAFARAKLAGMLALALVLPPAARAADAQQSAPAGAVFGPWGFDAAGQDRAVRPGDDFFRYANGAWYDRTAIPADRSHYGVDIALGEEAEAHIRDLLEQRAAASGDAADDARKIADFYAAFMDAARIERLGIAPIAQDLAELRAVGSREQLAAGFGAAPKNLPGSVFGLAFDSDPKAPGRYVVDLAQGGLKLPDRDYYLVPSFAAKKAAFGDYVAGMLRLIGWPDPAGAADGIIAFETRIAEASWTEAESRDPEKVDNPMTVSELDKAAPFAWRRLLDGADLGGVDRLIVQQNTAIPAIAAIYAQTALDTLKAWQAFQIVDTAAPYLPQRFADAYFAFHGGVLEGKLERPPRWREGVQLLNSRLGEAVGRVYVARYFPMDAKAQIDALVGELRAAFGARLDRVEWMSPATREKARAKLARMGLKIGYPAKWRDYSALMILPDDLVGDVKRSMAFDWLRRVARINDPVDRSEWDMNPQEADAYNSSSLNEIAFPAAILQPPFFDGAADPAVNYGAIGALIGHEMTHGFDDQGRKYDASGTLASWWTPQDADAFVRRAAVLGDQFGSYEPVSGLHINGALTMGENIADLGGLLIALDAYHRSLGGAPAPVIDGLTGDQRFFLGYAQSWRDKGTEDDTRERLVSNPHAPEIYRVNGIVRNVDAWYDAFDVKPGDALYLPPEKRVRIW